MNIFEDIYFHSQKETAMKNYRKPLTENIDFYDVRQAVEDVKQGSYDGLPYTSKVLAEQLVRRAEPEKLADYLGQLINREQTLGFPLVPCSRRVP